jgi:hypothetical protein
MRRAARWSLLAVCAALVLAGTTVWWSTRGPGQSPIHDGTELEKAAVQASKTDPRARDVLLLAGDKGATRSTKLAELYGRLAGDKSATGVRTLALNALFGEESLPLRLKGVLDAVVADPTPPREDPLWSKVTQRLSEQWSPDVFDKGRDLMLAEQRPRAKRALVESFVAFVSSGRAKDLSSEQSSALLTDLVDMHGVAPPDQKPAIEEAVRTIGGDDPADLLAGKNPDELELAAEHKRNLQAGVDSLMKNRPKD